MNVLITSAASATAQIITDALAGTHTLRLTDLPDNATGDIVPNELGHEADTDSLLAGIDAVVNIGFQGQSGIATRGGCTTCCKLLPMPGCRCA